MVCPHCGTHNDAGELACAACGSPLRTDAPRPERRYATVVFADLVGFTAFAEDRDPEDVHAVVDRCLSMLGAVVAEHGGSVTRVIGDEVMALFGAPVAHGDDAERAVRAALVMQQRMSADGHLAGGFQLRVGINTGVVLYAPLGPDATRRPTVMSDAVNIAARLRSEAEPAGVLVGRETYRTTRHAIDYADTRMVTVRGKSAPLPAWTALRARPRSQTASPWTLPLVDRTAEMATLQDAWRDVCTTDAARVVAVVGSAGIGKSRLVEAFREQLDHETARVLRGWALAYGTGTGYGPLSHQLRADAGVTDGQRMPEARTLLWARMRQIIADADELDEAQLAALAGLSSGEAIAERQGLLAFARRYLAALARRRPTALVFEDMHWADPSVLDLIELVATRTRDAPLLVVVVARPELFDMRPSWRTDAMPIRIVPLEPLGHDDARQLVSAAVADDATNGDAAAVIDRAGGNPLFILELVAAAQGGTATADNVPPTVQNLIASRLDALREDCRQLALAAAVVGKAFSRDDVVALRADAVDVHVDAQLDALIDAGVIQRAATRTDRYAFNHDLIRDTAYETLARSTRRHYHAQIARRLEAAHAGTVDELAGQVAYHWLRTDDPVAAVPYLVAAAERASHAWATQEAAALYSQALEVLPDDDERRPGLRLAHAIALTDAGDLTRACDAFAALIGDLSGAERVEALIQWSKAAFWTMDTAGAQRLARRAKEEAETIGAVPHARAAVHLCNALSSLETRTAEGVAEGEAIIRSWPADAPTRDRGSMLSMLSVYHYWVGDFGASIDRGREGYQISRDLRSLDDMLLASSHLALGLTGAGRHVEALQVCRDAAADGLAHELIPRFTARLFNMWANALRELGDLDGARRRSEEAIELGERAAFPPPIVQARIDLLYADLAADEFGRASRLWPELHAQAAAMKAWHNWLTIGRLATARAEILLATSEPEVAAEAAHEAIDHARRVGRRKYEVASRQVLGSALLAQRRPRDAVGVFEVCLRDASTLGQPTAVMRAAAGLRDAAFAAGEDDRAEVADGVARDALRSFLDRVGDQWRDHVLSTPAGRAVARA
ncbi:MAG TPA: adenylate/guanylate cyclase domain-containing protein [Euzebyales bacterium]